MAVNAPRTRSDTPPPASSLAPSFTPPPWSDSPWSIPADALALRSRPIFKISPNEFFDSYLTRSALALERAQVLVRSYHLTIEDVVQLRDPLWSLHADLLLAQDGAAGSFVTMQINLAAATIGQCAETQPIYKSLAEKILNFDVLAHFMLTEAGHGLDAINCETTATTDGRGGFILHTPTPDAAKYMPPTSPLGMASVGVVFAQLIHNGQHYGLRAFVVPITDGNLMTKGITCKLLPPRGGSTPFNHALTYFDHVQLSGDALLGPLGLPPSGKDALRIHFLQLVYRVAVGALAVSAPALSVLEKCAYITARFSQMRRVGSPGAQTAIMSFRSQHQPILVAIAQIAVFKELLKLSVRIMQDLEEDFRVRHAYAAITKASIAHATLQSLVELSDRCGARGMFESNGFVGSYANIRGLAIADGDVLVLSLRLVSELLIGRYSVHPSENRTSLLTNHEEGIFDTARENILASSSSHRGQAFSPIGYRMAYDAAVEANVDPLLVDIFHAWAIRMDSGWYAEFAGFTIEAQRSAESTAIEAALPKLDHWLEMSKVAPLAADNPLVSGEAWYKAVESLPVYDHQVTARL
ncbi:hypothetical protein DL96DRAFT_1578360 [Flagelloscypha sp. PMI_526]|nr:hypothetical protein DL96DRAFT_1578360 [Flagelloscypha sp. PMI_526]